MSKTIYQPYVYELTFLPTGQRYIGCEYGNVVKVAHPSNFWSTYFTSSRIVHELRESHDDQTDWSHRILSVHTTEEETLDEEQRLLLKYDAAYNPMFLNRAQNGNKPSFLGGTHSDEVKKKLSKLNKGVSKPQISKALKGRKIPKEVFDKVLETKRKNREVGKYKKHNKTPSIKYHCPVCNRKGRTKQFLYRHYENCGKPMPQVSCLACKKTGATHLMKAFHMDNCGKKIKKKQRTRLSCIYCKTEGDLTNIKRYHMNNCKYK